MLCFGEKKCRNFNDLYAHTPALRLAAIFDLPGAAVNKDTVKKNINQQPSKQQRQGVRVREICE